MSLHHPGPRLPAPLFLEFATTRFFRPDSAEVAAVREVAVACAARPDSRLTLRHLVLERPLLERLIKELLVGRDPALRRLFAEVHLNYAALQRTPYVALVGAVIGQKIAFRVARDIRSRLFGHFGGTHFTQEQMEELLADEALCGRVGLSEYHRWALRGIHRFLRERGLGGPAALDSVAAVKGLRQAPRVGPWTVDNVLLITLMAESTVFPPNDSFVQRRLRRLYGLSGVAGAAEAARLSERWRPYQGIVFFHLWRWF